MQRLPICTRTVNSFSHLVCMLAVVPCSEGEKATLSSDEVRRLQREAVAARRVKHTNCMQCYGFYMAHDKSKFYLLLEFLAVHLLITYCVASFDDVR